MRIFPTALVAVLALFLSIASWSADFAKGRQAYDAGDYQAAMTEWQPLAEEGNPDGQFGLGLLYANGFGVPLNDDQALKWYRSAAEQGHAEAQCNLAVMHANGWGVPQNDEAAFKWYSLSADQGVTQAQTSLAMMYSSGFGVTHDNVQAYKWFSIAVELGDMGASFKRDTLAERMSADELGESVHLAAVWMENFQVLHASQ